MITNYSTLKSSIADTLHRSDLTSVIPELIADGEAKIYSDLRIRAMETSFTGTTSGGTIALPAGYLEFKFLYADGTDMQKLERKDWEWIISHYRGYPGTSLYFDRVGEYLRFGPEPEADTALIGTYYKRLEALSDTNTTNWFITNEPGLLKFAALAEASPYIGNDARIAVWEGKYQAVINRLRRADKAEQFSGSRIAARAG